MPRGKYRGARFRRGRAGTREAIQLKKKRRKIILVGGGRSPWRLRDALTIGWVCSSSLFYDTMKEPGNRDEPIRSSGRITRNVKKLLSVLIVSRG